MKNFVIFSIVFILICAGIGMALNEKQESAVAQAQETIRAQSDLEQCTIARAQLIGRTARYEYLVKEYHLEALALVGEVEYLKSLVRQLGGEEYLGVSH